MIYNILKAYIVMSYPKGTPLIADRRAGIINSVWINNEKAEKERLRLISIDQEQLFTYEVEELEIQE
jgi:hypothetical protein